ncbi:MAG: hypothetical protein AB7I19_05320 [Planctomycetota bacterium]
MPWFNYNTGHLPLDEALGSKIGNAVELYCHWALAQPGPLPFGRGTVANELEKGRHVIPTFPKGEVALETGGRMAFYLAQKDPSGSWRQPAGWGFASDINIRVATNLCDVKGVALDEVP